MDRLTERNIDIQTVREEGNKCTLKQVYKEQENPDSIITPYF